jgi:hypothetical protein
MHSVPINYDFKLYISLPLCLGRGHTWSVVFRPEFLVGFLHLPVWGRQFCLDPTPQAVSSQLSIEAVQMAKSGSTILLLHKRSGVYKSDHCQVWVLYPMVANNCTQAKLVALRTATGRSASYFVI